jgi:hypothetical protein
MTLLLEVQQRRPSIAMLAPGAGEDVLLLLANSIVQVRLSDLKR